MPWAAWLASLAGCPAGPGSACRGPPPGKDLDDRNGPSNAQALDYPFIWGHFIYSCIYLFLVYLIHVVIYLSIYRSKVSCISRTLPSWGLQVSKSDESRQTLFPTAAGKGGAVQETSPGTELWSVHKRLPIQKSS